MARAKLMAWVGLDSRSFRRGLWRMQRRWNTFRRTVMAPMVGFGRAFVRGGIVIGAALTGVIKHANDFRNEMANVNTMLDGQDLEQYAEGILKMSGRFGMAKNALTKGLYDILSAGVAAEHGLSVLEVATRGAIGGSTDTAVSVDALTTVLNAFGMQASEATHVSDVLFQVVKDGKITYAELAENIGKVAPTAKAAGMSLEQLGAAIATIVKTEKPERAMTSLRQGMFQAAQDGQDLFDLAKRFKGASLEDVIAAGINKKTAAGVVILANNFRVLMKEVEKFKNVSGRATEAFEKKDKVRHFQKLWQSVLRIITRIGIVLDKTLAPVIEYLGAKLNQLADMPGFKRFLERVQGAAELITKVLTGIAQGGRAQQLALKGMKLVIIGAFERGARSAGQLLARIFPFLGKMLAEGAKTAVEGPIKALARRRTARQMALSRLPRGSGFLGGLGLRQEIKQATDAIVKELKAEELRQAMKKIEDKMNVSLGGQVDNLGRGMVLLKEAATEATRNMREFMIDLEAPTEARRAVTGTAATMDAGGRGMVAQGDREFSELRRIGANVLAGSGPQKSDNEQRTRLQIYRESVQTNKWLRELDKRMEELTNEWAAEDNAEAAVF